MLCERQVSYAVIHNYYCGFSEVVKAGADTALGDIIKGVSALADSDVTCFDILGQGFTTHWIRVIVSTKRSSNNLTTK